jgi:hypothetical protein
MRKISQPAEAANADQNFGNALTKAERVLGMAELDKVAGAGGNTTTSGNPVED